MCHLSALTSTFPHTSEISFVSHWPLRPWELEMGSQGHLLWCGSGNGHLHIAKALLNSAKHKSPMDTCALKDVLTLGILGHDWKVSIWWSDREDSDSTRKSKVLANICMVTTSNVIFLPLIHTEWRLKFKGSVVIFICFIWILTLKPKLL